MDVSANSNSGWFWMKLNDNEYVTIIYVHRTTPPDLDDSLDAALSAISSFNPTVGPRVSSSLSGYPMKYQTF